MEASRFADFIYMTLPELHTTDAFFTALRKGSSYDVSFFDAYFYVGRPSIFCSDSHIFNNSQILC